MGKQRVKEKKLPIAEKKEIFVTFGGLLLSVGSDSSKRESDLVPIHK